MAFQWGLAALETLMAEDQMDQHTTVPPLYVPSRPTRPTPGIHSSRLSDFAYAHIRGRSTRSVDIRSAGAGAAGRGDQPALGRGGGFARVFCIA